ncbi:sensor histidine kinase [Saccharibacillus deserti]|uniref:sensor histidine kinase n=1 Tax=Saccharibacillus deserti TaxID=1634444 RepID=UPI00155796A3|nr:HAMP domain-containing sensor histidine kinase [Saccharibacillus deserti]
MRNNKESAADKLEKLEEKKPTASKTKRLKRRIPGIRPVYIRMVLLGLVAWFVLLQYPAVESRVDDWIKQETSDISMGSGLIPSQWTDYMEKMNYALPLTLAQQNLPKQQTKLDPSDLFLPGDWNAYNSRTSAVAFPQSFKNRFNTLIESWQSQFAEGNHVFQMDYEVIHLGPQLNSIGSSEALHNLGFSDSPAEDSSLMRKYAFYAVVKFDAAGTMSIPVWYGMETEWRDRLLFNQLHHRVVISEIENISPSLPDISELNPSLERIQQPSAFTIVYALPRNEYGNLPRIEPFYYGGIRESGFWQMALLALGSAFLIGLLPLESARRTRHAATTGQKEGKRSWRARVPRLPFEFWLIGAAVPLMMHREFSIWSYTIGQTGNRLPEWMAQALIYGSWLLILTFWCGLGWFLMLAARDGFGRMFTRRSLIGRLFVRLHTFDPSDRSDRSLIKAFLVHFFVVTAIAVLAVYIGYYALAPLIPYMLAVFYRIKTDKDRIFRHYDQLYVSVQSMARGDLDLQIEGNLGLFDPLRNELQRIREGFKHAVEEETKSQKMKSELVTNVSHDLKTPLTAIVTYINLLQQANLTEEERRSYIDVLSGKSQRLNRLIEDLFEYTRASSGNTEMTPVDVDLVEMLKQAQIELGERLDESGVQLRFNLPERKVVLPLDSEKTFRIFENLYLNISKYAMPGSRAYVELTENAETVSIHFKNVSAAELDFKPDEIMERFVRGDRARSAEGSGLGLAIVKSLVELQGGTFDIELDGDLFKATIRWPKTGSKENTGTVG